MGSLAAHARETNISTFSLELWVIKGTQGIPHLTPNHLTEKQRSGNGPKQRILELWTDRCGAGVQGAWLLLKAGPMCTIALKHLQECVQETLVIQIEGARGQWLGLAAKVGRAVLQTA